MNAFKLIILLAFCFSSYFATAQFKALGLKAGANYGESVIKETFTSNGVDFTYATHEADVAIVLGVFARVKISNFFFQPEVLASNHSTKMKLSAINFDSISTLEQNRIDIPLLIGYSRKDKIRAFIGPVYTRLLVNSVFSDEFIYEESRNIFSGGTWGFQFGFGFDMGRLVLDAKYETSLGGIKDKVTIDNHDFSFDHRMNTVQVTLGFDLVK